MESTNPKDAFGKLKPSLTSIPPAASIHMALAMMNGAEKYGPYNWRAKTVAARVYLDAAGRHIAAWLDGEENAADSGIHHLGHALASLGIILDAQANGTLVDDRPLPGSAARLLEQFTRTAGSTVPLNVLPCTCHPDDNPPRPCPRMYALNECQSVARLLGQSTITATEAAMNAKDWSQQDQHLLQQNERRCVYIAGPMRGYPKFNFPAFDEAQHRAVLRGWTAISPADMDREAGIHEDTKVTLDAATVRTFVDRDTDALRSLRAEDGDAIALLPGWEKSTGAVAEFFLARWLGLAILDATTMKPFTLEGTSTLNLDLMPLVYNTRKTLRGE